MAVQDRTQLRHLACVLKGEVCGGQVMAPGRGHSAKDRSIAIQLIPNAPDGLLVYDHAGHDHMGAKDYVLERLGRRRDQKKWRSVNCSPPPPRHSTDTEIAQVQIRQGLALAIWKEGLHPRGTPVEAYLTKERGVPLPVDAVPRAIKFHPACPFASRIRRPAMIALVRNIRTNQPQAIHRTVLNWDGRKSNVNGSDRWSLGPLSGGAVKITADAEVTTCLGIGEGIESVLSLRQMPEAGPTLPLWALLSTSGVRSFEPLSGIEGLWMAVDHDPSGAGERAARKCAQAWFKAGAEVLMFKPTKPKSDLNDLFSIKEKSHAPI